MHPKGHEAALLERAARGDLSAREALWQANRRWVAAIILAHRPRSVEVEDLMQEVAVKFLSKMHTLRDAESFRPWLRQIAINACRGAARRMRPALRLAGAEAAESGEVAMPASAVPTGDAITQSRDTALRLLDHALTLPSEYREPLLMRCLHEMTYQQIGEILQLPVTTIETRLARARRMIREEFGPRAAMDGGS
jgi:RNA polymerase sigma-70 factor (ECF subfamily)